MNKPQSHENTQSDRGALFSMKTARLLPLLLPVPLPLPLLLRLLLEKKLPEPLPELLVLAELLEARDEGRRDERTSLPTSTLSELPAASLLKRIVFRTSGWLTFTGL